METEPSFNLVLSERLEKPEIEPGILRSSLTNSEALIAPECPTRTVDS